MTTFFDAFKTALGSQTIKLSEVKKSLTEKKVQDRLSAAINTDLNGDGSTDMSDLNFITKQLGDKLDTFTAYTDINSANADAFLKDFDSFSALQDSANLDIDKLNFTGQWQTGDDDTNAEVAFVAAVTDLTTKTVDFGLSAPAPSSSPAAPAAPATTTATPPAPATTTLSLDGVTFNASNKTEWMAALIPQNRTEGTPFVLGGTTYKYAASGELQKDDGTSVKTPDELRQKKRELIEFMLTSSSGAELKDKNLSYADLASLNFTGLDLEDTNLNNAVLIDATLKNTNLKGSNLKGANLKDASLEGADLENTDLTGTKLQIGSNWYSIQEDAIKVYNSSTKDWEDSSNKGENLQVINKFEDIVSKAKDEDKAKIGSKSLTTVISELKTDNSPKTPPAAKPTTKPAEKPEPKSTTTTTEQIQGIDRAKFGNLLGADETYLALDKSTAVQTALNVQILTGKIKINDKTPQLLMVDGLFGEKTAEIAQAWLNLDENKDKKTLENLLSETSSPPVSTVSNLETIGGLMLGIGSGGEEVKDLQTQLNDCKELNISLTVDGIYGQATYDAVMEFQRHWNDNHPNEAEQIYEDGVAGPQTRGTLAALMKKGKI